MNESSNLWVDVKYVNRTKGWGAGEEPTHETEYDNVNDLFKAALKMFGRCTSKMYVDTKDGQPKQIGWVFEKKMKYEDANEYFIMEAWVGVFDAPPTVSTTYHYHAFPA